MQEASFNSLIREDEPAPPLATKKTAEFDADAKNLFEFTVRRDGVKYDIGHVFNPLGDERFIQWLKEFKISGNDDEVDEQSREASVRLWDDQIASLENVDYAPTSDWKPLVDFREKIESINQFLAVAIAEDDTRAEGKLKLGGFADSRFVVTETWFNCEVVQQRHEMPVDLFEYQKKYSRIQGKRFKQEPTKGLRRKAKIEYIPQDEKIGELYDEMKISATGFVGGIIPLRFKTTVVHHLFEETLDQKKSER